MTRLDEFAEGGDYSQSGEASCIDHLLERIGVKHQVCVEFGASDGLSSSNTAHLWRDQGWLGILIEPDPLRFDELVSNTLGTATICRQAAVTPSGPGSIAELLAADGIDGLDVMSIDVDGDDWFILEHLACRPRVIVIEYNPTIPSNVELRQAEPGGAFGASLLAMIHAAERLEYTFVGATYCNAFFVTDEEASPFAGYETDPQVLSPLTGYTYAVSDFAGRVVLCGGQLPWGAKEPCVLSLVGAETTPVTDDALQLRRGFESLWGPVQWLTPTDLSATTFEDSQRVLRYILWGARWSVCIDLTNDDIATKAWLWDVGVECGYQPVLAGKVLGLIRSPDA